MSSSKGVAPETQEESRAADSRGADSALAVERARYGDPDRRGFVLRRLTAVGDLLALVLTGLIVFAILTALDRPIRSLDVALFICFIPLLPAIGVLMHLYHPQSVGRGLSITVSDEFAAVFRVATMWGWFLLMARSFAHAEPIQYLPSLLVWAVSIPCLLGSRSLLRRLVRRQGWFQQQVMVIGHVADASRIISRIHRHPEWGLTVVKELDVRYLLDLAEDLRISRVIFATPPGQLDARTDLTRC
ncbi:MAG TPA: hypothetical protein VM285_16745 [Polyangia bacterium]|nr:hypothetical protein [Polyangia bacterium]